MNWLTPCAYQPDCRLAYPSVSAAPAGSKVSSPPSHRGKSSPCSLNLFTVELPSGAHLRTPLKAHSLLAPLKLLLVPLCGSSYTRSLGDVVRDRKSTTSELQ